ncbi:MAG TPA: FAD/NAD(P)-binding oxidoreductase [Thermomicrobiales bacterium]|nr:FAD/NAD(P)-binding oxidoreductase [Thermomicrobiales bacterium]
MPHFQYLLVGGGMTSAAAVTGIRTVDPDGSIGLIGQETDRPYARPPLTKGLWKGKSVDSIWRKSVNKGVELMLDRTATELDIQGKSVRDDHGAVVTFDKLLLATGGTPRRLPFGGDDIIYFRTLADYQRLREMSGPGKRIGVIGGGFIGSELAAALTMTDTEVVMVFPDSSIGSRAYPADLAAFVTDYYREKGVTVLAERQATGLERSGPQLSLHVAGENGEQSETVAVDGVVAGIGIQPNVDLAERAGLPVDNGIVVDEFLRAGAPDIYAAGDVAAFVNPALDRRIRVEHEDNAKAMGRQAGRNMAGAAEPYEYLPSFYSDLFDLGYEAVGDVDARLETVADWTEPFRKGVIYYLQDGRVRGVLLWNVWDQVPAARELIAAPDPVKPEDLKGRLPS